jgi:hypothetical protein
MRFTILGALCASTALAAGCGSEFVDVEVRGSDDSTEEWPCGADDISSTWGKRAEAGAQVWEWECSGGNEFAVRITLTRPDDSDDADDEAADTAALVLLHNGFDFGRASVTEFSAGGRGFDGAGQVDAVVSNVGYLATVRWALDL